MIEVTNVVRFPGRDVLARRNQAMLKLIAAYAVMYAEDEDFENALRKFDECADEFVSAQQASNALVIKGKWS
jgi:hypothetical protein